MYVRCRRRFKDGKEHRYWSVVESCRRRDGRVVQRQVLHLGEINDGQRAAWCRAVEVVGEDSRSEPMALFAEDREAPELACETVRVKVGELSVRRPRQWGACWLALELWDRLELDRFWGPRLTRLDVLKTLAASTMSLHRLVRIQCADRWAPRRRCRTTSVPLPGLLAHPFFAFCASAGRRRASTCCFPDEHLLRERPAFEGLSSATAGQAPGLRASAWW